MILYPAVIVHGMEDAQAAVALGLPVTLLSAPGAAGFAGCLWWQAVATIASSSAPDTPVIDILDCADASGMAMAAIRHGVCRLVLWPDAPGHMAVTAIAERQGGFVLRQAPPALDLARRNVIRKLDAWLRRTVTGGLA